MISIFTLKRIACKSLLVGASLLFLTSNVDAQRKENRKEVILDSVEVVGINPLHSSGLAKNRFSGKVHVIKSKEIIKTQSLDVPDLLNRKLNNVRLNDAAGNPMQADISYRGFNSSSLLGSPQGLAVYSDGVRINELFGDVVNWEILPFNSIANLELVSGSNPLFGLNALGGAISVQTKSGFTDTGSELVTSYGSFGKFNLAVSTGGNNGKFGYFIAYNHINENGWRQHSPSNVDQLFGKFSWKLKRSEYFFTTTYANSRMAGNGSIPVELMNVQRNAVFTYPDLMKNQLLTFNFRHQQNIFPTFQWTNNVYARSSDNLVYNGDDSPYATGDDGYLHNAGDDDDSSLGTLIYDQNGNPIQAAPQNSGAINNINSIKQKLIGFTSQISNTKKLGDHDNYFVAGVNAQTGKANFNSNVQLGALSEDRGFVGVNIYDETARVSLQTQNTQASIYFFDSYSITDKLAATASTNIGYSSIKLIDQIDHANDSSSLNGNHHYLRVNPSIGLIYNSIKAGSFYFNYSISNRNPTPVELECADPSAPCRLPNSFLADPPLKMVVARTAEIGWNKDTKYFSFNANVFTTTVNNDIYFVSAGPSLNSGYFANIGKTARNGVEVGVVKTWGKFRGQIQYSYTLATFRENITVPSPNHPDADDGEIQVKKGNQIPLMPKNLLKFSFDVSATKNLTAGIDLIYNGSQYVRGDEANLLAPIHAYSVTVFRAQYSIKGRFHLFAKVYNLFNSKYETFGQLGDPTGVPSLSMTDPRFYTPSSPISVQTGLRITINK